MRGSEYFMFYGRLGRDPEMRYVSDGTPVTNFSVAVDRTYTKKDGVKVEKTIWYNVSAWRGLAETCNKWLKKGREVIVSGQLIGEEIDGVSGTTIVPRVYEANNGIHKASFEVTANSVKFVGGRGEEVTKEEEVEDIPFD